MPGSDAAAHGREGGLRSANVDLRQGSVDERQDQRAPGSMTPLS
jgi:hypothetical protein